MSEVVHDALARPLRSLRLSVTDRCNLRCAYCMPEESYTWLPRTDLLDFDELTRIARVATDLGVTRLRLTGGEPLLRRELPALVARLVRLTGIKEAALTTNGILLPDLARDLASAGLARLTVSLDTLSPTRFHALTRVDEHARVLGGIEAAREVGLPLKLDTVVVRGVNDDELVPLLEFAATHGAELRFIEYMDVGGATRWSPERVVSRSEILARIGVGFGKIATVGGRGSAPAELFELPGGQRFGVIASVTAPFCATCDRGRLTADGQWLSCLYARRGLDLKAPLRSGASDEELRAILASAWRQRHDRGAEERQALPDREPLVPLTSLRRDPHLEMHTRGG
ncbi:MAG: GTP 3',8-cyclase MoaA [Deltaproteobacteria bacterium]|nr:GTP 3',8-cyclase MoaA [Deltaproteobacteria bacterium]